MINISSPYAPTEEMVEEEMLPFVGEGHMDGSMEDLCTTENKRSLSFLLIFSDVLFHKSKSFDQVDDKKINRMRKDLIKSVMAF